MAIFLRQQDYTSTGVELKLTRPTAYPAELFGLLRDGFRRLFRPRTPYRQTGVVLCGLVPERGIQYTLFEDTARVEKMSRVYTAVDEVSKKFGKHTIQHAASLATKLQTQHEGERGDVPQRKTGLFERENKRQRLGLPVLKIRV